MTETHSAVHLLISGIVQGVGFRYWTERTAGQLGLAGWVRNLYDGRVEVVAQGPTSQLDRLVEQCHRGPTSAHVTKVVKEDWPAGDWTEFATRPTAEAPEN